MSEAEGVKDQNINSNILQQVRDALDAGLTNIVKSVKSSCTLPEDTESSVELSRIREAKEAEDADYIEIDDYCKMLQDCREKASFLLTPMDSRTLIPKVQTKLDSQHTPHSISDLHERISSFDIMKWSQKPDCISSFQCARFGWKLCDWGFLSCVTCKQILHIPPQISKLSSSSWAQRLRKSIESTGHLSTCPWTRIPSSLDILSIPKGTNLYNYLCEAVTSFKLMTSFPSLHSHYKMIMVDLNLKWLAELTSATAPKEDELVDKSVTPDMVRDIILFLVLNGWTMSDTDDLIKCSLCLREVPLWLCQPMPAENEILDLLSPPISPARTLHKDFSFKELDPVSNHWSWCPWRQLLQGITPADISPGDAIVDADVNVSTSEKSGLETTCEEPDPESIQLKKVAEIDDYKRVIEEFQKECANMSLKYDKENTGVQLLSSVSSFMDNIIAAPTGRSRSSTPVQSEIGSGDSESATAVEAQPRECESASNNSEKRIEDSQPSEGAEGNETNVDKESHDDQKLDEPPKKRIRREFFDNSGDL